MSVMGLSGLASGLDTTALISSQMAVEALPQTMLKNQVADNQAKITDFQTLNSKIAALADLAKTTSVPAALPGTSSSPLMTVTTTATAAAGSLDVVVSQTAQAQASVTAPLTAWPDSPPTLTFVAKDGTQKEITAASTSLDDVVSAINGGGAGVTATKVASGVDASGTARYRLQLTSTATGAAGAFDVYRGSAASVTAGTATNLLADPAAATVKTAQDAQVKLWAGTPAEQTVSSSTNTFNDLLPGVNVTVTAASATPATITVAQSPTAASKRAQDLVVALAGMFSYAASKNAAATTADSTGKMQTVGGSFTGDSTVRAVTGSILSAATDPVNGFSPSDAGITITKDGSVDFNADKFAALMASDPAKANSIVSTVASRVAAAATAASDPYKGNLTAKITGQKSVVTDLTGQIANWDTRLASREATLKATYTALETVMSKMNSQLAYLTSQLTSLPSTSKSN